MSLPELGRLEDLPQDYRDDLTAQNLVPLWPSLRAVLPPGKPTPRTRATAWNYQALRPLLLKAGELTPMEKAERRVLVLANPGHGLEKMQASSTIYLGMQLLLPGEWAPAHRHTPNAVRMIVEGEGAYTTVDGEKCLMQRGDLILTPTGLWHEHGHDGDQPVVWLDAFPMLRYPWVDVRTALQTLARTQPEIEAVQEAYINPETGADAQKILGFSALMLRPGETLNMPARSTAMVFHVIEGGASVTADASHFALGEADTCCIPGYTAITLVNASTTEASFVFMADDAPLQKKLGVYEVRDGRNV